MHGNGVVTLSPLYDVSPTTAFLVSQDRAALPVAGKFRLEEITRRHLLAEARTWGIPEPVARKTISTTLERLEQGVSAAQVTYDDLPAAIHSRIEIQFDRLARSDWQALPWGALRRRGRLPLVQSSFRASDSMMASKLIAASHS